MGRFWIILAFLMAAIYGASYQQFRHFDPTDPRGANDSESYIKMSHGDFQVNPVHRYRFLVPLLAGAVRPLIGKAVHDPVEQDKVSFYVVNFGFTLIAAWVLLLLLQHLGFSLAWCLVGTLIFTGSRITILVTGTPLVDAPYFAASVIIVYLTLTHRVLRLSLLLPLLLVAKETVLLVALLPLLQRDFRKVLYCASLAASIAFMFYSRAYIDGHLQAAQELAGSGPAPSLLQIAQTQLATAGTVAIHLFTPGGFHDLQNGYSFFLLFAVLGFFTNRRTKFMPNDPVLLALVPIALLYAVLSGNTGRMIFVTFPVAIPYALIYLQDAVQVRS